MWPTICYSIGYVCRCFLDGMFENSCWSIVEGALHSNEMQSNEVMQILEARVLQIWQHVYDPILSKRLFAAPLVTRADCCCCCCCLKLLWLSMFGLDPPNANSWPTTMITRGPPNLSLLRSLQNVCAVCDEPIIFCFVKFAVLDWFKTAKNSTEAGRGFRLLVPFGVLSLKVQLSLDLLNHCWNQMCFLVFAWTLQNSRMLQLSPDSKSGSNPNSLGRTSLHRSTCR